MKKTLLVSLTLLTLASLAFVSIPQNQAQTSTIKILSYTWYIDISGYLSIAGEIQNTGPNTISKVIIRGIIDAPDGNTIDCVQPVWGYNLRPGQKAPFYLPFYYQSNLGQTTNWGAWPFVEAGSISFEIMQADATATYQYPDLEITQSSNTIGTAADNKGLFSVSGTIKNTGSQTAQNVSIAATFYNSTGGVVAVGHTYPTTVTPYSIPPQATATFKVDAFDQNQSRVPQSQKIASYSLLIQNMGPMQQGSAPVPVATSTPIPATTDTPNNNPQTTPNNGNNQNNQTNNTNNSPPIWAYAVVIIIVAAAIAGTILTVKKRKSQPAPAKLTAKPASKPTVTPKRKRAIKR
ncbi:MAG: FxLYD domain-containing protein [Candidatus Bathyarchaeota archaeon]|nr:FxLYD domain-containing protein [Candidatus Bathyarchaeota archaeon]